MEPLILLGIIAGLPVALALLLRVNAVFLYVSVVAGHLLVQYVGDDADLAFGMILSDSQAPTVANFVLQLAPVVLTILFLKKTLPASKMFLHIIPSIAIGLSLAVFVLSFLSNGVQDEVLSGTYGELIQNSQDVIVAAASLFTLLLAWLTYRNKEASGRHK